MVLVNGMFSWNMDPCQVRFYIDRWEKASATDCIFCRGNLWIIRGGLIQKLHQEILAQKFPCRKQSFVRLKVVSGPFPVPSSIPVSDKEVLKYPRRQIWVRYWWIPHPPRLQVFDYSIFHFKCNSTMDLLLTKNLMVVIMQCNTATLSSRATVRGDALPKAPTRNIWANKASLFISAQSQPHSAGVSHSKVALIPANGAHEIVCGHYSKEMPVTWYASKIIWVLLICTLSTHFRESYWINLCDWTSLSSLFTEVRCLTANKVPVCSLLLSGYSGIFTLKGFSGSWVTSSPAWVALQVLEPASAVATSLWNCRLPLRWRKGH